MADRRRYDSAMFWLAFGTAAAVIGLALMTIGATRSTPGANLLGSRWFDTGLGLLALGGLLLLWALLLYLLRRRTGAQGQETSDAPAASLDKNPPSNGETFEKGADWKAEAVRGYYAERDKMLKLWDRQERKRRQKN